LVTFIAMGILLLVARAEPPLASPADSPPTAVDGATQ